MPTYDYECPDCQHAFQRFHSMTAEPIKLCPSCEGTKVRRLIGAGAGLIFKGSGFYITDYRSKNYQEAQKKAESTSSSDAGSKSSDSGAKSSDTSSASTPSNTSTPTAKASDS